MMETKVHAETKVHQALRESKEKEVQMEITVRKVPKVTQQMPKEVQKAPEALKEITEVKKVHRGDKEPRGNRARKELAGSTA